MNIWKTFKKQYSWSLMKLFRNIWGNIHYRIRHNELRIFSSKFFLRIFFQIFFPNIFFQIFLSKFSSKFFLRIFFPNFFFKIFCQNFPQNYFKICFEGFARETHACGEHPTRYTRVLRAPQAGFFSWLYQWEFFCQIFFPNFFFQIFLSKFSSKFFSEFFFKLFFQIFCQNSYNHEKNPAWGARNTRVSRMRNPRNKCRKNFEKNFDKKI